MKTVHQSRSLTKPVAEIFKALGHPARVRIVRRLSAGEHCVCDLVEDAGLGWSTVSRHLSILKEAGILTSEKRGLQVYYQLALPCVSRFIACLDNPETQPEWMLTSCSCS